MTNISTDSLRAWFRGVERILPELWNAAWAMCGNDALAEEALNGAIIDVWLQEIMPGPGFRDHLRGTLRRECLQLLASPDGRRAEFNWPGLRPANDEDELLRLAAREPLETQRLLTLCRGCGLSPRMAVRFTDQSYEDARAALRRLDGRCRRSLPREERRLLDTKLNRQTRRALTSPTTGMPRPERVYRDFEAEAMAAGGSAPRLKRVLGYVAVFLMSLLCAVMFWVFAVISTPQAEAETGAAPPAIVETVK